MVRILAVNLGPNDKAALFVQWLPCKFCETRNRIKVCWAYSCFYFVTGLIAAGYRIRDFLGMGSANERRRYRVALSLIGCPHIYECGLSQWKTTLHCNVLSHWLKPYPEWSLHRALCLWQAVLAWSTTTTAPFQPCAIVEIRPFPRQLPHVLRLPCNKADATSY